MAREPWETKMGWRQQLSRPIAMQAGKPYSCPWWADEQVYALAFLQGKCRTTQGPLRKRWIKQRAGETGPPQERKGLQGGALKETAW